MTDLVGAFDQSGPGLFALLILYVAIRDVVVPLVRRRNGEAGCRFDPASKAALFQAREDAAVNRQWHEPDDKGEQTWRGARLERAVEANTTAIGHLDQAIDRLIAFLREERP